MMDQYGLLVCHFPSVARRSLLERSGGHFCNTGSELDGSDSQERVGVAEVKRQEVPVS